MEVRDLDPIEGSVRDRGRDCDAASHERTQTRARGAFARSRAGDDCVKIYAVAFARSYGRSRGRVGDGEG